MALTKNSEAVSPVIGTILMVAVTVILAAVIAMYVFGLPANVTKTKVVAATAQLDQNGDILITYQGGQNDDTLSSLNITAPDGSTWYTRSPDGALVPSSSSDPLGRPIIGSPMIPTTPAGGWPPGSMHVMVVGAFSDGVNQVILDTFL
jgi:flagellin-like protein